MPHSILLIGGHGMLGRAWQRRLQALGVPHAAPPRSACDLCRPETLRAQVDGTHPVVVNCAAWTDVDGAESQEHDATRVNGAGVGELAAQCRAAGAKLLHYSTDYVFDGHADRPYRVDQPRAPLNAYGRSKAEGERLIQAAGCEHLIVRTSWLYAPWGANFVRTMVRLMREKPRLRVVDDQRGRPTSCHHLVDASLTLLERQAGGVHHVSDGGECTWYAFACEIARGIEAACAIEPCASDEFPRPAARPAYSVLDLAATERLIGPRPPWQHELRRVLAALEEPAPSNATSTPAH